jgi:hypothetical protein
MIAAMLFVAVLFVVFVFVRPPSGCSHECSDCDASCDALERSNGPS